MANQISQQDFAFIAADSLCKKGVNSKNIKVDFDQFALYDKDERGRDLKRLFLANFHTMYSQAALDEERQSVLEKITQTWFHPIDYGSWKSVKSKLRIVIRDRYFYHSSHPSLRDGTRFPQIEVGEHLTTLLAVDSDSHITLVHDAILNDWGKTFEEAWDVAHENLQKGQFSFDIFENKEHPDDCVYLHEPGDQYGSSRLIFINGIADEAKAAGNPIIFVPRKDTLIVTGSDSMYGLTTALKWIEECQADASAIFPEMLSIDEDYNYFGCRLPEHHPLYVPFHRLELKQLNNLYARWKDDFSTGFDQLVSNKRIANFKLFEGEDVAESACAFMRDECGVILPQAEFVFISDSDGVCAISDWANFIEVMNGKIDVASEYPQAIEVVEGLSDDDIDKLGIHPKFR